MRSRAPAGKIKNKKSTQRLLTEPVCESLTLSQARGLLTRAQIRTPLDCEIITLEAGSNTINNVKAKIQQDSGQGGLRIPIKTLTGKTPCF
jgi:hypothetical protein